MIMTLTLQFFMYSLLFPKHNYPFDPPIVPATWLPITYAHTSVIASHYVGVTVPGIIEDPGSFSGNNNSPKPDLGPEPRNLISLAILFNYYYYYYYYFLLLLLEY